MNIALALSARLHWYRPFVELNSPSGMGWRRWLVDRCPFRRKWECNLACHTRMRAPSPHCTCHTCRRHWSPGAAPPTWSTLPPCPSRCRQCCLQHKETFHFRRVRRGRPERGCIRDCTFAWLSGTFWCLFSSRHRHYGWNNRILVTTLCQRRDRHLKLTS